MTFTRPGVQTELDRFFKAVSKSPDSFESISKSAFSQSRKKLKPEAFIELTDSQLEYFYSNAPRQKTWKGCRVVSIDGSLLNLPHTDQVKNEFGSVSNQHEEVISARCSFAYDVENQLIIDAIIAPRKSCEKDLAVQHLEKLNPETDLLVFDRGYPSQWLFGLLQKRGFKFCFRISTGFKHAHTYLGDQNDLNWTFKRSSNRARGKLNTYNLPDQIEGLRLVSIPLSSGEKEVLVTNLTNRSDYSLEQLKNLYNLRWGVEEAYKTFKKVLHIEHFSGKSVQAIKQDFHAKVFMMNIASMIRSQAVSGKPNYQANKTQVLAKVKDFLVDITFGSRWKKIIQQMLKIIRKRTEIIRPNRSFPRSSTSSRRRSKIINSKGI